MKLGDLEAVERLRWTPQTFTIVDLLLKDDQFTDRLFLTHGRVAGPEERPADFLLHNYCAMALVRVWLMAHQFGLRNTEGFLVVEQGTLGLLDTWGHLPGLGQAMNAVHWARLDVPESGDRAVLFIYPYLPAIEI